MFIASESRYYLVIANLGISAPQYGGNMKKLIILLIIASFSAFAADDYVYVTIGADALSSGDKSLQGMLQAEEIKNEIAVVKVKKDEIYNLSEIMHESFKRCGGYVLHESKAEAIEVLNQNSTREIAKSFQFNDYSISMESVVKPMVAAIQEIKIRNTIETLSGFRNRFYKSKHGVNSMKTIKKTWETLAKGRSDVKVRLINHKSWAQPSVELTITGSTLKDEIVVLGGHGDSIAGMFGGSNVKAPGADDNASGIATLTEIIRVAMVKGYKPKRTIKFFAYAAEEVGLRGSKEIANTHAQNNQKVVGVMQLDMTNHKGTATQDIVMMNDFTNAAQNTFLGKLIDKYVHVPWGYSKCGYGCSDHASWHNKGYPASMPFESTMGDINRNIHTARDTINQSQGTADHAEKFAKLGTAFLVEMGK